MEMSPQDREKIASAIRAAEAGTSGEIVCVLAQSSSDAAALPVLIAAMIALATPWALVATTAWTVQSILWLQLLVFVALTIFLCLPRIRVALIPRRMRRAMAFRVAAEQFVTRGIARKKDRSGVLIFVSLAEHYVRIIADDGIAARVHQREWEAAVAALIEHMRADRIVDGFIAAIGLSGTLLARHFPRDGKNVDELPDRIYFI